MIKLKQLGLTTVGTLAIATPIATVVSCGSSSVTEEPDAIQNRTGDNRQRERQTVDDSPTKISVDKMLSKFSDAFKLSSTNTTDNDLIKNGKIASSTDIQSGKANFSKKILLNITLSDELQNDLKQEYEKAKQKSRNDNGYTLELKIEIPSVVEGQFFENDINSEVEAEKISQQIQDLETNDKTKVGFNLELPTWLNKIKDIDLTITNGHTNLGMIPDFTNAWIQGVKSNGNKVTSLSLLGLRLSTFDQSKFPKSLKTLKLDSNNLTSLDVSRLSALTHLDVGNNHSMYAWGLKGTLISTLSFDDVLFPSTLKELGFTNNWVRTFDTTRLPQNITSLNLEGNYLKTFDTRQLPSTIKKFNIKNSFTQSFDATTLPPGLTDLDVSYNSLRSFDATQLPKTLINLNLKANELPTFDATQLPSTLKNLNLEKNKLMSFDAGQLPSGLKKLSIEGNHLSTFNFLSLPEGLEEIHLVDNMFSNEFTDKFWDWWQKHENKINQAKQDKIKRERLKKMRSS